MGLPATLLYFPLVAACSGISADGLTITLPLQLRVPALQTDAADHVRRWEEKIHRERDQDGESRMRHLLLTAVCETESGRTCDVPTLPRADPAVPVAVRLHAHR